jgi:hypothetical protein
MRVVFCGVAAVVLLSTAAGRSQAADAVTDLLGWVPGRANAVLLIDADEVQKSQVAVKGNWGAGTEPTFGLGSLPPNAARLVVASQLDPSGGATWEVVVASQRKPVAEPDFVRRNGGTPTTLGGRPVILTPRHGIVATLAPGVVGAYQPPARQEASRWLKGATGRLAPDFSPYLRQAGGVVGPTAPVVLAFDTADMFDPAVVKAKLEKATSLNGTGLAPDTVAALVGGMRGVTLTLRLTDRIVAEARVDFDAAADPVKAAAKPLLLEVLEYLGVHDEEMNAWTATVLGNTVTFGGELTLPTVDHLLRPFLRPSAAGGGTIEAAVPGADPKVQASLKYFRAVDRKIREVREGRYPHFSKLVNTFNATARQIDDLPILHVDEELLDWGNNLTATLRMMAIMVQAANSNISQFEANKALAWASSTPNFYFGSRAAVSSGTGSAGANNPGPVLNIQAMTRQQEPQFRMNTWKNVEAASVEVRRKMVKKYGIEF